MNTYLALGLASLALVAAAPLPAASASPIAPFSFTNGTDHTPTSAPSSVTEAQATTTQIIPTTVTIDTTTASLKPAPTKSTPPPSTGNPGGGGGGGREGGSTIFSGDTDSRFINGQPVDEDPGNPGGFGLWIIVGVGALVGVLLAALGMWYWRRKHLERRARRCRVVHKVEMRRLRRDAVRRMAVSADSGSIGSCETAVERGRGKGVSKV